MKYAYVNGMVLDGTEHMSAQRVTVLTDGENIERILPAGSVPNGYKVIDLAGRYLLPGLINLHVHLPGSGKPKKKAQDNAKVVRLMTSNALMYSILRSMCAGFARTELMSGVTTIRTMGGVKSVDSSIRDAINAGKAVGPRILACNMAVSVPGGHMAGSLAYTAQSADDAAGYVRLIAADRPDMIKLMITGGVLDAVVKGEPGVLKMPPEYVKACCGEAHALGYKVAAHVESAQGVRVALENGVDSIEHGAAPDDEILELFKKRNACVITTISPALPYAFFDRSISHATEIEQYNGRVVFDGIIACARACLENGIPVGLGTDTACPYITHYDMWRELVYYCRYCGVDARFALYSATLGNAKIAGIDGLTGSIEAGKCADMIAVEKNPLEDLTTLRNVSLVVARGKPFSDPKVKKMPQVEKELDKFL